MILSIELSVLLHSRSSETNISRSSSSSVTHTTTSSLDPTTFFRFSFLQH